MQETAGAVAEHRSMGLTLLLEGEPSSLLKIAASNAFWHLPLQPIQKLCEEAGVVVSNGTSLFAHILALTQHVLQVDEAKALEVLQLRLVAPSVAASDFLQSPHVADAFDDGDMPCLEEFLKEDKQAKVNNARFHEEYLTKVCQSKGRKIKRNQVSWPPTITVEWANSLLPPDSNIIRDTFNNRWQGHKATFGTCSRSWPLYGDQASLTMVLRQLWAWHKVSTGLECPFSDLSEDA